MHKKRIINLILVFITLMVTFAPVQAQGGQNAQPHPDPHSGKIADYAGEWIIDGMTMQNTTWKLEITADGKYVLYNDYQLFDGEVKFTPGKDDVGDTIELEFDPSLGIAVILENMANALFDVTGQGLIFVRPGNRADLADAEDLDEYPLEKIVNDWMLSRIIADGTGDIPLYEYWDAEEFGFGKDNPLILSFENGYVYSVSLELGIREAFAKYRWTGRNTFYIFNPPHAKPCCTGMIGKISYFEGEPFMLDLIVDPGIPQATVLFEFFQVSMRMIEPEGD